MLEKSSSFTHAVAVEADNTVFIALYVPCGANIHDTSFILPWIPCSPKKCIIGGDWNRLATKTQWLQMLEERGLHVCSNPLPFTRVQPDGRPGATLDRVAASCHTVVTHLQVSGLADHLIMHVKIGHSDSARPFPKHVQQDPGFVERLQVLADMFAGYSAAAANDPGRLCELWEALKKSIVKEAHRCAKQTRKRAKHAPKAVPRQEHSTAASLKKRVTNQAAGNARGGAGAPSPLGSPPVNMGAPMPRL